MFISDKHEKVMQAAIKRIKPTEKEKAKQKQLAEKLIRRLDKITPSDISIELAGSTAKGTNLSGDMDFDIFMLFSKKYSVKELMSLGIKYAKRFSKGNKSEIAYAQHPYLRAWIEGIEIDIVPSYRISDVSEMLTAVDRSPLHTKYVNSKMNEKQKDDVRLLKRFLKTQGIYGAEGRIQGFSGYLCELLVLKYGSFMGLLDAATQWKGVPAIMLAEKLNENEVRKKYPDAAMVVIDPVDPERNVAASVSKTSLTVLMHAAKMFLNKPGIRAFLPVQEKIDGKWIDRQVRCRDSLILGIEFERPKNIVDDILWPQLYKFAGKVADRMKENKFEVFDIDVYADGKCLLLCELSIYSLPKIRKIAGPPLTQKDDVERFIREHSVTEPIWFENERILAVGNRRYVHATQIIEEIIKKPKNNGVPPDILRVIKTSKILNIKDVKKKYTRFLFEYLKTRNVP